MSDEVSGYPGAPPGWYADPAGGPGQRWWDGYAWTEATVLPAIPPPPPPPPPSFSYPHQVSSPQPPLAPAYPEWIPASPDAAELVKREIALTQTARAAFAYFGLNALVSLLNLQLRRSQFLSVGHDFRIAYEASRNGKPVPTLSAEPVASPITTIFSLLAIVAVIFALIWQFRAASAARALGFKARRSPGWGVGSWFVPIVNFWMPYQAIRDCLPPTDPHRPFVLRWWLLVLGTQLLTGAATFAAFFSSPVALAISLPAAVAAVGVIATAPRLVAAISASHQQALGAPSGL